MEELDSQSCLESLVKYIHIYIHTYHVVLGHSRKYSVFESGSSQGKDTIRRKKGLQICILVSLAVM